MENDLSLFASKPVVPEKQSSILRTAISLALYIALDYWIFKSWLAVLLLVTVIFIHESGHFIAMKIFGYTGVNMTFIPFVGAYVSGEAVNFSRRKKIIVLFAGPLPGIITGAVLFVLYQQNYDPLLFKAASVFLLLNVFNLVPVSPLDGGQIFETLFFSGNKIIQLVFLYISVALVFYFVYKFQTYALLIVTLPLITRIAAIKNSSKTIQYMDENDIDYHCSFEELTDEQYWEIRNAVIINNKALSKKFMTDVENENEHELIPHVKALLAADHNDLLPVSQKIFFVATWLAAVVVPVFCWLRYSGKI